MIPVAILAGGRATRLKLANTPKSLVDVHGEPFIAHQLRLLADHGIEQVILCVGFLGLQIKDFVRTGRQFGVRVEYSFDAPFLLGTGGALKHAAHLLGNYFFVLYGDSYLECDYKAIQQQFEVDQLLGLMSVTTPPDSTYCPNVEFVRDTVTCYNKQTPNDKMTHIDYGLGVLDYRSLTIIPSEQYFDLAQLYQTLAECGELGGFFIQEHFHEIGSFAGLERIRQVMKVAGK